MKPLPDINPMPQDNSREFADSWRWIAEQYNKQRDSLDKYMQRQDHNAEYALRQKAFLSALAKHMNELRGRIQFYQSLEKILRDQLKKEELFSQMLFQIAGLHGINVTYFIQKGRIYLHYLLAKAHLRNAVRLPDVFQKHFPKSDDGLFTK